MFETCIKQHYFETKYAYFTAFLQNFETFCHNFETTLKHFETVLFMLKTLIISSLQNYLTNFETLCNICSKVFSIIFLKKRVSLLTHIREREKKRTSDPPGQLAPTIAI